MEADRAHTPEEFRTFGELLKFLRRHRRLTQLELALAVGYSESQISHLEQNHRAPDKTIIADRFIPALNLQNERTWATRLLELAIPLSPLDSPSLELRGNLAGVHNPPTHWTSFVGRERELAAVVTLLTAPGDDVQDLRLFTLTGAGGSGKTRLAIQASPLLVEAFEHGIWWVDLDSLSKPSLVPQSVGTVLGIKDQSNRPMLRVLTNYLRSANLLIVLDNCEHLVAACAALIEALLRECPHVKVLVTSREVLNIAGETVLFVPPLSTPVMDNLPALNALTRYEAVRLFLDRARTVSPSFQLTNENASAVTQICQRLDGIPLAIELAAARLRMLSVEQIAQGLDDRFRMLTGGRRTAPPRHQTLHALVDWSYDLLSEPERVLFVQLGIFAGGWTLEAAQALARLHEPTGRGVIELLGHLIDKSLVIVEQRGSRVRYRMLDTIRQYARAKLNASRHRRALERAHAIYFMNVVKGEGTADAWFFPSQSLHDNVHSEYDNVRAALGWCQSSAGDPQLGIELTAALLRFWFDSGNWSEWRIWVEGALTNARNLQPSTALAQVHFGFGTVLAFQSEFRASREQLERSLALYQALGDVPWSVYVTFRLGWLARERGEAETARGLMEPCLAQFRALGDVARTAEVLVSLAEVAVMQQDPQWAKELLNESMTLQEPPDAMRANLPWALNHLGHVAQLEADFERARELHSASLKLFSQVGVQHTGIAWAHQGLGESALAIGDLSSAPDHLRRSLVIFRDLGDRMGISWCLAGLAAVASQQGDHNRAATLWGASETLRHSIGARPAPAVRAIHERLKSSSRARLGEAQFQIGMLRGGEMPLHEAIRTALASADENPQET